ncbi:MAG TPA: hypothetical protein VKU19_30155 [Bryobacteraceae bacterium]|nr:hypothetical protein [Bryobacteraceae bacterium]
MTARSKSRLVTVLLIVLAAFTGQLASIAVASATQVTVYAAVAEKSKPSRVSERPITPTPARPDPPEYFEPAPNPPRYFVTGERFQRPPPSALFSLA